MKFLHLFFAGLGRKKVRTTLTFLSILVAFVLFSLLMAFRQAFSAGVEVAGLDRLVVRHKVSIIQLLPESYRDRMERIEGVSSAVFATWFGGYYQEEKNFFAQIPVQPEPFMEMFPEYILSEEEKAAWLATRTGAIVGEKTATRFGFEVGDKVPIQPTIWRQKGATEAAWEFDIVGIYEGEEKGVDTTQFFFRHDYFDEARTGGQGQIGWYWVKISDTDRTGAIVRAIDDEFANSPAETKTEPEGAFVQGFANQIGNMTAILTMILGAAMFMILLITGNTMAQTVRERTQELAVLKAIGYTNRGVLALVLGESCLLAFLAGLAGLALGYVVTSGLGAVLGQFFPVFFVAPRDLLIGVFLALAVGVASGLLPAVRARRVEIAQALRG